MHRPDEKYLFQPLENWVVLKGMNNSRIFSFAQSEDESGIVTLLAENNLPYDDIGPKLDHFIVCLDQDRVVGVVGLEPCGKAGLLRSLAIAPDYRGKGIARELSDKIEEYAALEGIEEVYVLTLLKDFCAGRGFEMIERAKVPAEIQATREFAISSCAAAVCMRKSLVD